MARKKRTLTVDISGLRAHHRALHKHVPSNLNTAVSEAATEAREIAVDIVNAQIYDTPERGYDRTGALKDSITARKERPSKTKWRIIVSARGGAGGREYALYNERGTYDGRVTLESIRKRAEVMAGLILLQYGNPSKGLEPRPWTIPTMVMVSRFFAEMVMQAVRDAEAATRRART